MLIKQVIVNKGMFKTIKTNRDYKRMSAGNCNYQQSLENKRDIKVKNSIIYYWNTYGNEYESRYMKFKDYWIERLDLSNITWSYGM